ncbi:Fatty acid desaturase [Planctomycetes bacterium Pan216]|uniref:Fatty acid desaturase n=1 Tax=Kolteria novifilia TaxID=2527975 RepID=A0A518AXK5_9BACT|nr:Fatty acid desaturase [Planctomycetes bacterium Pan216]
MATVEAPTHEARTLKSSALKEGLRKLVQADNTTNIFYLVRTWLFLVACIGGALLFDAWRVEQGLAFWWSVPAYALAIVCIGAGQHQLTGLAHEASHHTLFRHRIANDLVSDLCCMFPLFSSTHHYRLQHMAHHQFVNDPERDPDVSQLRTSGHWLDFPLPKDEFLRTLLAQLWPLNLIRYIRVRAQYNAIGTDKNPYIKKNVKQSKLPVRVGIIYLLSMVALLTLLVTFGQTLLLAIVPVVMWVSVMTFYAVIPKSLFHQSRVRPVVSSRTMTFLRITFLTTLFLSIAWTTHLTGHWVAIDFFLLWVMPIFTSFSFFMILRQLVQHGNGDRGWLTNTRVFFINPMINFAVFPFGQDYHLPHHMFATVPHYRLRQLHELLLTFPEYREEATVVEGYFAPPRHPAKHPTVVDVLGPEFAPHGDHEAFIDHSVLEGNEIEDRQAILEQEIASKREASS